MQDFLCHFMLISLLFASIEGAADMGEAGHAHTDHASEHAGQEVSTDTAPDVDADHCEHCCHGHVAGIAAPACPNSIALLASNHLPGRSPFTRNFGQAPPTPPPNA